MEWIRWAEGATVSCGGRKEIVQDELHPPGDDPPPTSNARASTVLLKGLARIPRGASTTHFLNRRAAAWLDDPSAKTGGSPQRRRQRRFRAWCSKAWGSFRPTTNADLSPPSNEAPAHELVFLRKDHASAFFEQPKAPPNAPKDRDENPRHPGASVTPWPTEDAASGRCSPAAVTEEDRLVNEAAAFGRRLKQEQLPVLVPCLRSGRAVDLTSGAAVASAAAAEATPRAVIVCKKHSHSAECREVFPASANDDGQEGHSSACGKRKDNDVGQDRALEASGTPAEPSASEQKGRTKGMVAASVRAGDWVLPARGWGGFAGSGTNVHTGGGSTASKGGNKGSRWVRVEAVSIGDELIMLATPGTGGTRNPTLRASLTLLRLNPALLPGALVVRQIPPSGPSGGDVSRGNANGGGREGVGCTEAFRLPVLCAEWGLSLLREWAAADTASKALDIPVLLEENARRNHKPRSSSIRAHAGLEAARACDRPQRKPFPLRSRGKIGNKSSRVDGTTSNGSSGSENGICNPNPGGVSPRSEPGSRVGMREGTYGSGTFSIKVNANSRAGRSDLWGRRAAPVREGKNAGGGAGSASRRSSRTKKEAAAAGSKELEDGRRCVLLRLAAPARERELSLAWTTASVANYGDEISVELFTPGGHGCRAWTLIYRGLAQRFDVKEMEPCRRYRFRARLWTAERRGGWRHTSFCTRPDRPSAPLVTRWTPGVPAVGVGENDSSWTDESLMGEGCTLTRGICGWRNLHLQLRSGDTMKMGRRRSTLGEECGTWVVEVHTRLRCKDKQLCCTENRAALEWAGDTKAKSFAALCDADPDPVIVSRLGKVDNSESDGGRSTNDEGGINFENGGIRRRRGSDTGWKLVYRGKRPECVVGSLAQGTRYAFRCARANADDLVGPWSNHLRCVVPVVVGRADGGSSGHNDDVLDRTQRPPPPNITPRRFDLLVPALVEAFASLVDDGGHRIARGNTDTTARKMPPSPPPSPQSSPTPRYPAANYASPKLATTNKIPQTIGKRGGRNHHDDHQRFGISLISGGEASAQWDEARRAVWEEHWDSERHAPFFTLLGQDLSVWQIPALQIGTAEYGVKKA